MQKNCIVASMNFLEKHNEFKLEITSNEKISLHDLIEFKRQVEEDVDEFIINYFKGRYEELAKHDPSSEADKILREGIEEAKRQLGY